MHSTIVSHKHALLKADVANIHAGCTTWKRRWSVQKTIVQHFLPWTLPYLMDHKIQNSIYKQNLAILIGRVVQCEQETQPNHPMSE
jgi:hypothetical protein